MLLNMVLFTLFAVIDLNTKLSGVKHGSPIMAFKFMLSIPDIKLQTTIIQLYNQI
jgi:hypothetical protein